MTQTSRRPQLEALLADSPQDQFLRYSLAMELQKEGDHDRSVQLLRELLADMPPYGAAFFMLAKQLVGLRRLDEARAVLRDGIAWAREKGERHAASEMSEYLTTLGRLPSET